MPFDFWLLPGGGVGAGCGGVGAGEEDGGADACDLPPPWGEDGFEA